MKVKRLLPIVLSSLMIAACSNESAEESQVESEDQTAENVETEESSAETAEESTEDQTTYVLNDANWRVEPAEGSDADSQVVLMTIDDAPDNYAVEMAETLKEHDVPAIFFVNGMFIADEAGQDQLRQIHDMGFEIGNHTYNHPNLQQISEEDQRAEIVDNNDLIEEVIGTRPRFFRAPFGANTDYSLQVAAEENMQVMNWSYGYDWEAEYQNPDALADIMVNNEFLSDGANLLMHDRDWTNQALEDIILGLEEKGYGFVNPDNIESGSENEL